MPSPKPEMSVLVTAFGAFPGARTNPTVEIVRRLMRSRRFQRLGIVVTGRVLPVVFSEIDAALATALASVRPDVVIHLGLAGRRRTLSVESRALNRIGTLRADAARRTSATAVVAPRGVAVQRARWPVARLVRAMRATGAATRLSIDAGDYLCNQLLYLTLATSGAPVGFIHVPRPGIGARYAKAARPSLSAMTAAVEAAIVVMAAESRRRAQSRP